MEYLAAYEDGDDYSPVNLSTQNVISDASYSCQKQPSESPNQVNFMSDQQSVKVTIIEPYEAAPDLNIAKKAKDGNPCNILTLGPILGPQTNNQIRLGGFEFLGHNHLTGHVEPYFVDPLAFDEQYNAYQRGDDVVDPSDYIIAEKNKYGRLKGPRGYHIVASTCGKIDEPVPKRNKQMDPTREDFTGPWAATPIPDFVGVVGSLGKPRLEEVPVIQVERETSILHVKSNDYQGRSWLEPSNELKKPNNQIENYLPKKCIYTYVGHSQGVNCIKLFPNTGHLLLSASMDGLVKIWDVHNKRKNIRTYMGHTHAVRDVCFKDSGNKFFSASFDMFIHLWDTETGKIIKSWDVTATPYCVSVHPNDDHVFLVAAAHKKAVQFDDRSPDPVQEYAEHLGPVNTATFCDRGTKIITTSDDKKIFIWDYGIPVVTKHIAQPCMHAIPAVKLTPDERYILGQSMDNQIVVYEATGRFRFQGKRRFRGHANSGYAIRPTTSTDGRFVVSGDSGGKIWFWDWKYMKNLRTLLAHKGVVIDTVWHPNYSSKMFTCGWDGTIKIWD